MDSELFKQPCNHTNASMDQREMFRKGLRFMVPLPISLNTPKPTAMTMTEQYPRRNTFSAPIPLRLNDAHAARYPIPGAFRSVKLNHKEEQNKRKR